MGVHWTAWHLFLGYLLRTRGPRGLQVLDEVRLSAEAPRIDYLLVLKPSRREDSKADDARTLRRLWPMLPRLSVVEYKSPTHPYRRGDLDRLWGYVHLYWAYQISLSRKRKHPPVAPDDGRHAVGLPDSGGVQRDVSSAEEGSRLRPELRRREDLCAVLIVSKRTPSLDKDVAAMGLCWEDCSGGYWRVRGGLFELYLVEIDVAGPAEGDDVLYSLGHGEATAATRKFAMELVGSKEALVSMEELEGFTELMRKVLAKLPPEQVLSLYKPEQRLAGLPPEQVLSLYKPEQRLAGLDRDHAVLALPMEMLLALSADYVRSLSPEVQAEIQRRIGKNGHTRPKRAPRRARGK